MKVATIPVNYINEALDRAVKRGCNPEELVDLAKIPKEQLNSPTGRVSIETYIEFSQHLAIKLNDESCGLMRKPVKLGSFSMLCHACINNCRDLSHFLYRCTKFYNLMDEDIQLKLSIEDDLAHYAIKLPNDANAVGGHMIMISLAISHRLASWAINKKIILTRVNMMIPKPSAAKDYDFLFSTNVNFGQERNELIFSTKYLDSPIEQDEQNLKKMLEAPVLSLMSTLLDDKSMAAKIRTLIKKDLSQQLPSFEVVASHLNYTTATLRRRLNSEGITYKQIKDDLRRDIAIYQLEQGVNIEQVAQNTGFSETSSFFRSFKRWTGTTPRSYTTIPTHS